MDAFVGSKSRGRAEEVASGLVADVTVSLEREPGPPLRLQRIRSWSWRIAARQQQKR
jgi:hypothetical protein